MLKRNILLFGTMITLFLLWFAISNYRDSLPIAEETLFGLAHSLNAAIENSAIHDPSLRALSTFQTPDIAYFALVDKKGVYRFHSNQDLIGTSLQDKADLQRLFAEKMIGKRIKLATGEEAYELVTHINLPAETLALRIVLHTYRADAVIRRAQFNMLVLISLMAFGWILAFAVYRYARREERHRLEMATRDNLVKMGEMGAMLAHEIRNPLAGIKGFAQLITKKADDPRTKDSADRIVTEVRRLESLVTDLLDFAASDEFASAPVSLAELVDHTASLVRSEAEQINVTITVDCPADVQVSGNNNRLAQVLLNIVRNGIQAMPDGGTLNIALYATGTDAIIRISDTGHGIRQEDMHRIFEPFFTTKPRGSGLGLALCKKIIEEHHGSIGITSDDRGTAVTLSLPKPI